MDEFDVRFCTGRGHRLVELVRAEAAPRACDVVVYLYLHPGVLSHAGSASAIRVASAMTSIWKTSI
jgi:hypothetical protein